MGSSISSAKQTWIMVDRKMVLLNEDQTIGDVSVVNLLLKSSNDLILEFFIFTLSKRLEKINANLVNFTSLLARNIGNPGGIVLSSFNLHSHSGFKFLKVIKTF
jgi:hypothetical protein